MAIKADQATASGEFGACLEERLKDRLWVVEIVVDNVDEIVRVHDLRDELPRR